MALVSGLFDWFDNGGRFLEAFDLDPEKFVIHEILPYLDAGHRLYVLPEDPSRKSQCCIEVERDLVVHVKLVERPDESGLFITFGFHRHNTGYAPLPQ